MPYQTSSLSVANLKLFPFLFLKDFIYLFETRQESEHEQGGGAKGEREGEADSPLSRDPDLGLNPRTLRS